MSVSNGQYADETTFNTSFVSRETDTGTVGKLALQNADSVSGPSVANPQRELNLTKRHLASHTLTAGATIPLDAFSLDQRHTVQGSPGAVTLAAALFGAGPFNDDTKVRVVGAHATNKPTINNADVANGVWLRDGGVTLGLGETIELNYNSTLNRWVEQWRNF